MRSISIFLVILGLIENGGKNVTAGKQSSVVYTIVFLEKTFLRDINDLGYVKEGLANIELLLASNARCKLVYKCIFPGYYKYG